MGTPTIQVSEEAPQTRWWRAGAILAALAVRAALTALVVVAIAAAGSSRPGALASIGPAVFLAVLVGSVLLGLLAATADWRCRTPLCARYQIAARFGGDFREGRILLIAGPSEAALAIIPQALHALGDGSLRQPTPFRFTYRVRRSVGRTTIPTVTTVDVEPRGSTTAVRVRSRAAYAALLPCDPARFDYGEALRNVEEFTRRFRVLHDRQGAAD